MTNTSQSVPIRITSVWTPQGFPWCYQDESSEEMTGYPVKLTTKHFIISVMTLCNSITYIVLRQTVTLSSASIISRAGVLFTSHLIFTIWTIHYVITSILDSNTIRSWTFESISSTGEIPYNDRWIDCRYIINTKLNIITIHEKINDILEVPFNRFPLRLHNEIWKPLEGEGFSLWY